MNPILYFWLFLKASLFSSGGTGNLPSLHGDLLAYRAAAEQDFAEAVTIGQIAPGPNGLWSVSLGYLTWGWPGAVLALLAATLPPLLVLAVERLYRRVESHPAVEGFIRGLSLAIAGVSVVVMLQLLGASETGAVGAVTAVVAAGLMLTKKVPVIAILAIAGAVGVAVYGR